MKYAIAVAALLAATPAFAQQATFNDPLVDHLAGKWVLSGQMDKGSVTHDITAEWVLAHQYLELHEISREKNRDGSPVYQAKAFIGWDAKKQIYDCVWLDDYGSISTQSLGYAKPNGNSITFVFQDRGDPGSFHTAFIWHPEEQHLGNGYGSGERRQKRYFCAHAFDAGEIASQSRHPASEHSAGCTGGRHDPQIRSRHCRR